MAGYDFVALDDGINVVFNPHLGPPSRETLAWAFSDPSYMRRYVPLGWLGFSLVYGCSGLSPVGYHAANVALHVVNATLVFALVLVLLRRFARDAGERWQTACATLAALGWALHPFRAETVGWASGLLYGLSGCAALLSVLAYLRAWAPGAGHRRWLAAAALLYAASMLCYPMSLGLWGVFLLLDVAHARAASARPWWRPGRAQLWFAVPFGVVLALTLGANYGASEFWGRPPAWADFGLGQRLQQMATAWAYYLWKPWWPTGLTPVPTWLVDLKSVRALVAASLVVVGTGSLLMMVGWRRWRGAALLWWAHACLLAPMLGFAERPYFASDRYHYLAAVVLAAAVALALARIRGRGRVLALAAGAVVLAGLGSAQRAQLGIWADTDAVMRRIVARADHAVVRADYVERWVRFHVQRGEPARAAAVAAEAGMTAAEVEPTPPGSVPLAAALHLQLALDFRRSGRPVEAQEHFRLALGLAPDWNEAAYHWALLYASEGTGLEALRWYQRAVAPGRGRPVPVASRQRLLALIAEVFFATDRAGLARRTVEWALREGGGKGAEPELDRQLRAQLAR